ncbi:MAG TPA: hypothetical protein VEU33_47470, partial [Archangium sp.]|nr:hypothetical protein [Archangium sp.]
IRLELELEERRDARQLLLAVADQLGTVAGSKPLEERLRDRLLAPLTLLCIDNVDAPAVAAAAAELVRLLPGCALVVTGSSQELGLGADWTRMKLRPLDEPSALEVLQASCPPESAVEWAGFHRLIRELGGLPLVLQLAAGQLRRGGTVNGLREDLRRWTLHAEGSSRALLRQFFASSLGLLRARLAAEEGGDARRLMEGLYALGLAPAAGVGRSLGAAMAGLSKEEFETLVSQASALSLLERDTCRVHPLLAELLREAVEQETVTDRMTEWFARRLEVLPPGRMDRQLTQWMREVREELCALASWLPRVPVRDLGRVGHVGADYARHEGPLHLWLAFYERAWAEGSEPEARSHALGILSSLALQAGSPDRALSAAHERRAMARSRGDEHAEALASAALADVLGSTGALDEALRIQREEVLPVFTRLGDTSWQARTWARIADLHGARGELDEALRLWRDEALPVFQRLGDLRGCAVTQARIAEVLASRSELEEAMRLLLEEILPCFKRLDDLHGHASTLEQIANVLLRQGRTWEARDVLIRASTYYTFLGDTHQADSVRKRQAELMSLIR